MLNGGRCVSKGGGGRGWATGNVLKGNMLLSSVQSRTSNSVSRAYNDAGDINNLLK